MFELDTVEFRACANCMEQIQGGEEVIIYNQTADLCSVECAVEYTTETRETVLEEIGG